MQTYRLWTGSRRLDIETEIDWHQRQVLLKARFPLAVRTHEATFETMYGACPPPDPSQHLVGRGAVRGSAHRFADLSEPGYGVALLNDGKYGYGAHDNVLNLSLLREPALPGSARRRRASTTSPTAVFPHAGDWTEAGVVAEAFALNSPLIRSRPGRMRADGAGFVRVDGTELGLGALKQAEDGNGLILRVYEPNGARGPVTLRFAEPVKAVERVNLLEEPADGADRVDETAERSNARRAAVRGRLASHPEVAP